MKVYKVQIGESINFYADEDVAIDVAKRKNGIIEGGTWSSDAKKKPAKKAEKVEKK